jgi:hypothetical protein
MTRRMSLLQDCARDNVQSAAEIVRFALSSTPVKAVHQLSSLLVFGGSVFERNSSQDQENGPNLIRRTPENADVGVDARTAALLHLDGVTQSLFVAEKLLAAAAREHGVPLRVYRPGFVGWHSKTRAVDRDGYLARLLAQMAHSGPFVLLQYCALAHGFLAEGFPTLPARMYNDIEEGDGVFVNVTPVDYLSAALVHLALANPVTGHSLLGIALRCYRLMVLFAGHCQPKEQKSDGGSAGDVAAFHLVHGGGVVRLSFLVELLRRRGYTVR